MSARGNDSANHLGSPRRPESWDLSRPGVSRLLVFGAALACVFLFQAALPISAREIDSSDYVDFYAPVAHRVLEGRGVVLADGRPAIRFPPGYPVLLVPLFYVAGMLGVPEVVALAIFSAACVGLACLLLFELAASVWPRRRALLAPAALMSYPLLLWLTKQPSSEVPFLVPFYASVFLFWSLLKGAPGAPARAVGCGVTAGAAMLIRPIAIGLGILFGVLAAILMKGGWARRLGIAVLLLLGNLTVVLPWEIWVYRGTGKVIPLSTAGVPAMRDGLAFAGQRKGYRQRMALSPDLATLEADIERHYRDLRSMGDILELLREQLAVRPGAVTELIVWKAARSWYGTDSRRLEGAILVLQIPYLFLIATGLARSRWQGVNARRFASLVVVLIGYFWAMSFVGLSIVRYMVPAIGLGFAMLPSVVGRSLSRQSQKQVSGPISVGSSSAAAG